MLGIAARPVHDRVSVSAISTFAWYLPADLAFYARAGITNVGISIAKLERHGWDDGAARVVDAGLRVTNLIGLGPFHLAAPERWPAQQERLVRALDVADDASAPSASCSRPDPAGRCRGTRPPTRSPTRWHPVLAESAARGVPFAIEHTNSLRVDVGFVHTLADAVDLARRLGTGVCMEINACWAERDLAATIRDGVDALRLVQVSDFAVGTLSTPNRLVPGDGDIPLDRIVGTVLAAGYPGCFDLELIGPAIDAEGYEAAVPRAVATTTALLEGAGA